MRQRLELTVMFMLYSTKKFFLPVIAGQSGVRSSNANLAK